MVVSDAEICSAIHGHHLVRFIYRGKQRIAEAYAYGLDAGGHPILRAYQVAGESDSGVPAWKLFRLEEVAECAVLDDTFDAPREGYMRNDPAMTKVYCEV
jgi:hypothetical protein